MAIYHLSVKIVSRGHGGKSGRSAIAAAAYRSGEKLTSDYDGVTYDYRSKSFIDGSVILLPNNAPKEYLNRQTLWNAVEQVEKQCNAQLCREVEFSLPIELSPEEQKKVAIEFIQEQFVSKGMIADVCFHKQHMKGAYEKMTENPHAHTLLTLRPIDENGKWEPKNSTVYICEKDGIHRPMTSAEIKEEPGWEKLYNYQTPSGEKSWLTKSYVREHEDEGYTLVNKYPKRETIQNPKISEWNSKEMLLEWRRAWAEKLNTYFDTHHIEAHVDHRSYKEQGLDLVPTIHEGKDATAIQRKFELAYEKSLARGEDAVLKNTEIREINIAIKIHNEEVKLIAEMKRIRAELEKIVAPVIERLKAFEHTIAEQLERLRAGIISLTVRIRAAVDLKGRADEKISANQAFIHDLAPVSPEKIEELREEKRNLEKQLENISGIFSSKRAKAMSAKIELLSSEIKLLQENICYAAEAKEEVSRLKLVSDDAEEQIVQMEALRDEKIEEYAALVAEIPTEDLQMVQDERLTIRPRVEEEFAEDLSRSEFEREAVLFDEKMSFFSDESIEGARLRWRLTNG